MRTPRTFTGKLANDVWWRGWAWPRVSLSPTQLLLPEKLLTLSIPARPPLYRQGLHSQLRCREETTTREDAAKQQGYPITFKHLGKDLGLAGGEVQGVAAFNASNALPPTTGAVAPLQTDSLPNDAACSTLWCDWVGISSNSCTVRKLGYRPTYNDSAGRLMVSSAAGGVYSIV
jgi:hypothetical protein